MSTMNNLKAVGTQPIYIKPNNWFVEHNVRHVTCLCQVYLMMFHRKASFLSPSTYMYTGQKASIHQVTTMLTSAENRDPNLNRLIGLFNERSSILDRSLSHSKHVTMNLGRDYKSGTQPQLTCPTYLRH